MNNTARIIAKAIIKTNDGNYESAIEMVARNKDSFAIPHSAEIIDQIKEIMVEEIILNGRETDDRETDCPISTIQRIKEQQREDHSS